MESVVRPSVAWRPGTLPRLNPDAVRAWALAGTVVLYLSIEGGGYDLVVRSQAAIVVWWVVLVGAAWGLLPVTRLTRVAWMALALFGGFVAWTALATTWSLSSERSLDELSRVACYLGILLLGISIHRERGRAVQHTVGAVAAAVVLVACLGLASRLRPDLFPAAHQTASYLPGTAGRLGWPLNSWNALAALLALGLPLLLAIATSARRLPARAAAAAGIPLVSLCMYLTFSRGSAMAAGAGLLAFFVFSPERVGKLATALVTAAGSAVLILAADHRAAIEQGLTNGAARHQGATLLLAVVVVCAGVALAQTGVGLADRHGTPPRWLTFTPGRARALLVGIVTTAIVVALLAGGPGRLSHAWQDFKHPNAAALNQDSLARFGSASGNGRYDYWKVAVDATGGHLLGGSGAGTYQLLWSPRAPYFSYVQNAHSLYLETLAETGIVGLVLLAAFLVFVLAAAARLCLQSRYEAKVRAAGLLGALVAFVVAASSDWIWQVPALPAAFLLLAAAVLAPAARPTGEPRRSTSWVVRAGAIGVALAALVAVAIPLATVSTVRESQAAVDRGNADRALADARAAVRLEPGAASAQVQLALVLELRGDIRPAVQAARNATDDEPSNWSTWLVDSRLEAEAGHPAASVAAYRRSRILNPQSPLFKQ
ncbi:MAG TPA: O-antigen ligase family protein [Solirubrobacteraceae bacterium]|nr:O-antigen ligase family protein [Solirubrobacteraceae bacterium]